MGDDHIDHTQYPHRRTHEFHCTKHNKNVILKELSIVFVAESMGVILRLCCYLAIFVGLLGALCYDDDDATLRANI